MGMGIEIRDSDGNVVIDGSSYPNTIIGTADIPRQYIEDTRTKDENGWYTSGYVTYSFTTEITPTTSFDLDCLPVADGSSRTDSEWYVKNPWFVVQSVTQGGIELPYLVSVSVKDSKLYIHYRFTAYETGYTSAVKVLVGLG